MRGTTAMGTDRDRRLAGYSLLELLAVLALLGVIVIFGGSEWINARKRGNCVGVAKTFKSFMLQARMLSVYRGVTHFVVFDPATNSLSIVADSTAPSGVYNATDTPIAREVLPDTARLALPASPSPLPSPLGGGNVTSAWSVPLPDTSTAWGSNLRGVRATATGLIQSVEATPQVVGSGVIVFSDPDGNTAALGIRGQTGTTRAFQLLNGVWREL